MDNNKNEVQNEQEEQLENTNSIDDKESMVSDIDDKNKDLKDQLLRSLAEIENMKKRHTEEINKIKNYAVSNFAKDMIEVMDSMHMAIDSVNKDEIKDNKLLSILMQGLVMTNQLLSKAFSKHGIARIEPKVGEDKFNPDEHEALLKVQSEYDEDTVVKVIKAGYKIHSRLIIPALLEISSGKE